MDVRAGCSGGTAGTQRCAERLSVSITHPANGLLPADIPLLPCPLTFLVMRKRNNSPTAELDSGSLLEDDPDLKQRTVSGTAGPSADNRQGPGGEVNAMKQFRR